MFRSSLEKKGRIFTTKLLQSYKNSFESFVQQNNYVMKYENSIYSLKQKQKNVISTGFLKNFSRHQTFNYKNFIDYLKNASLKDLETALLPLAAFFKVNLKKNDYYEILNVAHSYIVEYNNIL